MPRLYTVSFKNVVISAAQDLVALKGATGKVCQLRRVWIYQVAQALPSAQGVSCNVKFASGVLTFGTGGAAATPNLTDPGDQAATFTARINDTAPASTAGAFTDRFPTGGHIFGLGDTPWRDGPYFGVGQGIVFELLVGVSGGGTFNGGVEVMEIG